MYDHAFIDFTPPETINGEVIVYEVVYARMLTSWPCFGLIQDSLERFIVGYGKSNLKVMFVYKHYNGYALKLYDTTSTHLSWTYNQLCKIIEPYTPYEINP